MKFAFAIVSLCAVSVSAVPAVVNTGHSAQFRSQDSLGNYAFGYNEDHATGGTFRRETGSPGIAQGSYGLRTIDGRVRVVNYVADGLGFRANVQTNEPGVEDQDPASVLINKAAAIVAPYITKAAPIAIQQSYEAPVVHPAPLAHPAPVVQAYEAAPLVHPAPVVQSYEAAPVVQAYEPAPIVEKTLAAPLLSTYTTKTYAAPSPILSGPVSYATKSYAVDAVAPALLSAPLSPAYAAKTLSGHLPIYKSK